MFIVANTIFASAYLCQRKNAAIANFMEKDSPTSGLCGRIADLRRRLDGDRGKARFAKRLGISASTYNYYEAGRAPRAELLVKIADVAGADLRWLLTGQASEVSVPADHPAVGRIAALLADHPEAAEPLAAFVDILAESLSWPKKQAPQAEAGQALPSARGAGQPEPPPPAATPPAAAGAAGPPGRPKREWIPILGRSAAGVPQFWADAADGRGVTVLADLIAGVARRAARQVAGAVARDAGAPWSDRAADRAAQFITLTAPDADNVVEFVAADRVKRRHPDAFAVRIDGDSMAPEIAHGDVVICCPSAPAVDGQAAVVQLDGQIGVTCKLYRREGDVVHLIPVNERYAPESFPAGKVVWALAVVARVTPA